MTRWSPADDLNTAASMLRGAIQLAREAIDAAASHGVPGSADWADDMSGFFDDIAAYADACEDAIPGVILASRNNEREREDA